MPRVLPATLVALAALVAPASAQTSLLTASPIPESAESRFCYYAGLAYSRSAYILIGGGDRVTQVTGGASSIASDDRGALQGGTQLRSRDNQKLLECVVGADGLLGWSSVATVQIGK